MSGFELIHEGLDDISVIFQWSTDRIIS